MAYHLSTFKKMCFLLTCLYCKYVCTFLKNLKLKCVVHANKIITVLQKNWEWILKTYDAISFWASYLKSIKKLRLKIILRCAFVRFNHVLAIGNLYNLQYSNPFFSIRMFVQIFKKKDLHHLLLQPVAHIF